MTNQLIVDFHGICVHFKRSEQTTALQADLPAAHRVVLPHWPAEIHWLGQTALIHEPALLINNDLQDPPPMHTTMSLGLFADEEKVKGSFNCSPRLRLIDENMQLNAAAVTGQQDPGAIYFDIDQGTLSGINFNGSAAVRLTINTEATTANLTLTSWSSPSTPQVIPIALPATITVANVGKDPASDATSDFILSFAVATPFPPAENITVRDVMIGALQETGLCLGIPAARRGGDLGTGCSNSHFP